jgi:hypothetical protein
MDHTIGRTQYSNARNMHSLVFIDPTITTTTSTSWKDSRREVLHSSTYLTDTGFKEEVYHAYTFFNERNTWHDWFLVPTERPVVEAPAPKTNLIDIPGADGAIDATTVLTGYPLYSRRTGSWTFKVMNGYYAWDVLYSRISSFLHGRTLRVMLEDDAMWFYEGRFEVSMSPGEDNSEITISYDLDPYKYKMWTTQEDWLWDNMDFEYGFIEDKDDYTYVIDEADTIPLADIGGFTIESHVDNPLIHNSGTSYSTELVKVYDPLYSYKDKKYYGEADVRDLIGKKPVCPKVIVSGADATNGVNITLESNDIPGFTSKTYNFKNGETTNRNFRLTRVTPDSTVNLVVNGSCTLKLDFRRGEL